MFVQLCVVVKFVCVLAVFSTAMLAVWSTETSGVSTLIIVTSCKDIAGCAFGTTVTPGCEVTTVTGAVEEVVEMLEGTASFRTWVLLVGTVTGESVLRVMGVPGLPGMVGRVMSCKVILSPLWPRAGTSVGTAWKTTLPALLPPATELGRERIDERTLEELTVTVENFWPCVVMSTGTCMASLTVLETNKQTKALWLVRLLRGKLLTTTGLYEILYVFRDFFWIPWHFCKELFFFFSFSTS